MSIDYVSIWLNSDKNSILRKLRNITTLEYTLSICTSVTYPSAKYIALCLVSCLTSYIKRTFNVLYLRGGIPF